MSADSILRRKVRRDLRRQRWQFLAVAATIALGVMVFATTGDAFRNLEASYSQTYADLAFADLTVSGGDQQSFAGTASSTDGVAAVVQRTQADIPFHVPVPSTDSDPTDQTSIQKMLGRVVGLPDTAQPDVDKVQLQSGGYLDPTKPDGVLVEVHMADHFDLQPNDKIQILLADGLSTVTVLGTVASPEYLFPSRSRQDLVTTPDDFGVLFIPEALAKTTPAATQVAQTLVLYDESADQASLDSSLRAAASQAKASDVYDQDEQASNAALSEDLQGFAQIAIAFPMLFLTAAGMATLILLNRIVLSQRGVIGTLAANGMRRRTLLGHYLSFGLIVGIAGAAIGLLLGAPLGSLVTSSYTKALSIPDTVVRFYPLTLLVGLAFGLVTGVAAAFIPARTASSIEPAEAMRGEVPTNAHGRSLIERMFPPLRHAPIRWRMSLRGIGREKRRTFSTIIGVVLALVLMLSSWGMIDTTRSVFTKQFDEIQHNDAQVFLMTPVGSTQQQTIAGVEGVDAVEPVITLTAATSNQDDSYSTQIQAFETSTQMHTFIAADGSTLPLPTDGVLAGSALAGELGIEAGDTITIGLPTLDTTIEAKVVDFVDEPLGTIVYGSRGWLTTALSAAKPSVSSQTLESPAVSSLLVSYEPSADADTVKKRLNDEQSVAAVITTNALQELFESSLAFFYAFVGVMLAFGGLMAFALIFNTISVNIAERSVELATMRANGLTVKEVNRLITGENLLVTAIAIPIGLIAGYWSAAAMMSSYTSDLFSFSLTMFPSTLAGSALVILVVTIISQWPGLRAIRRLDIAATVRERAL